MELGARLVERSARREAAKYFGHAVFAAGDHGGGKMMGAGDDVGDDFSGYGVRDGGLEDADDGGGARAAEALKPQILPITWDRSGGLGVQNL